MSMEGLGVMYYADTSRGKPFSKDPAVVWAGDRYLMYYSLPSARTESASGGWAPGWGIGIAESHDLETWERIGEIAPEQSYEARGFCAPGALVRDGVIHLFYQTYGNGRHDAICHAESHDGMTFTRNSTNPIFAPTGDWTSGRAIDADVITYRGEVFLYFATRDPDMRIQMLGVASARADSSFRREDWRQRCDGPILRPELAWEQECIEAPALVARRDGLYMFYAGAYNNCPQQIGCAFSDDGVTWRRLSDRPFLANGAPGSWNASESGHPFAFVDPAGRTHLFFQGNDDHGTTWYLSRVEVGWNDDGPLLLG